ncbi:unnamed protein product [Prunus armeniaca]
MGCRWQQEWARKVGRSTSIVPTKTIVDSSIKNGRSLASVPQEDAILPFPDQWDASLSLAEPSTCLSISSPMAGALQDPGTEALLQSYKD